MIHRWANFDISHQTDTINWTRLLSSGTHWTRWICDTCSVLNMCRISNASRTLATTQAKPQLILLQHVRYNSGHSTNSASQFRVFGVAGQKSFFFFFWEEQDKNLSLLFLFFFLFFFFFFDPLSMHMIFNFSPLCSIIYVRWLVAM